MVEAYCSTQRTSAQLPFVSASSHEGYDFRPCCVPCKQCRLVPTLGVEAVLPLVVEFEVRSVQAVHLCVTAHKGFPPEVAARVGLTVFADSNRLFFAKVRDILHATSMSEKFCCGKVMSDPGQPGRRSRGGMEELSAALTDRTHYCSKGIVPQCLTTLHISAATDSDSFESQDFMEVPQRKKCCILLTNPRFPGVLGNLREMC